MNPISKPAPATRFPIKSTKSSKSMVGKKQATPANNFPIQSATAYPKKAGTILNTLKPAKVSPKKKIGK